MVGVYREKILHRQDEYITYQPAIYTRCKHRTLTLSHSTLYTTLYSNLYSTLTLLSLSSTRVRRANLLSPTVVHRHATRPKSVEPASVDSADSAVQTAQMAHAQGRTLQRGQYAAAVRVSGGRHNRRAIIGWAGERAGETARTLCAGRGGWESVERAEGTAGRRVWRAQALAAVGCACVSVGRGLWPCTLVAGRWASRAAVAASVLLGARLLGSGSGLPCFLRAPRTMAGRAHLSADERRASVGHCGARC